MVETAKITVRFKDLALLTVKDCLKTEEFFAGQETGWM